MLVMVVFFIAFRWIHLSTPLIRLFLSVLILLLMPTINFLPVWFALSLLRFRLPSRLPMMFILWMVAMMVVIIFFSSRRRHTRFDCDWSSDVCSSDLVPPSAALPALAGPEVDEDRRQVEESREHIAPFGDPRHGFHAQGMDREHEGDRKSTRLNSSHSQISYAVFCLK